MSAYSKMIIEATGCSDEEAGPVEDIMRHEIFHSTLDWQSEKVFKKGAILAYKMLKPEAPKQIGGPTPTPKTPAQQLYYEAQDILGNLFERWIDEQEYEDINDYSKPLCPLFEKFEAKNVKMHKRPFGFTCTIGTRSYRYSVTMRLYSMKEERKAVKSKSEEPR